MNNNVIYTIDHDEAIPTHERDGVVEHKHAGFEYWHPVSRKHDGCGSTDHGVDSDVRMCMACDCVNRVSMCHTRRRQLGMIIGLVAHGFPMMGTADTLHIDSISRCDTLMMVDEAMAELVSAKSMIDRAGKDSDHVQQGRFEQFARTINGIVSDLLKISSNTEEEMEAKRNEKNSI